MKHPVYAALFLVLALGPTHGVPSLVTLDSGEQLIGEILPRSNTKTLVVKSSLLGQLEVPRLRVISIQEQAEAAPGPFAPAPVPTSEAAAIPPPVSSEVPEAMEEKEIMDALREFRAPDSWSGNLRIGINLSGGDRKWAETYARGKLEVKPEKSPHFYRFAGSYITRETERSNGTTFKSTDKYDGEFIYRRTFRKDWFFQNAMGGRVDQVKGIDHELQETIGLGYRYKLSDKFELLVGGGGGIEDYEAAFDDSREGLNPIVNIFQEATWRPLRRTSIVQKFNYYWNAEDSNRYNYVLTTAIRVRFTDLLGFEFSYNKNFDNDIGNGRSKDDTQWRNALVVYF